MIAAALLHRGYTHGLRNDAKAASLRKYAWTSVNERLADPIQCTSDGVIGAVLSFLILDVRLPLHLSSRMIPAKKERKEANYSRLCVVLDETVRPILNRQSRAGQTSQYERRYPSTRAQLRTSPSNPLVIYTHPFPIPTQFPQTQLSQVPFSNFNI